MASESFFRLDGRTALVTGGGRGIGEAICRRLASAGARVVVFDLGADKAALVARSIGGLAVAGDVTSEADVTRALAEAERAFAPVDILVNNAGITGRAGDDMGADARRPGGGAGDQPGGAVLVVPGGDAGDAAGGATAASSTSPPSPARRATRPWGRTRPARPA